MATFVLVHGAWHGAWCWRRVVRILTQAGHEVFTPALTGVGERSHLLKPDVNLDTHILDVANEMKWQELNNVVLVGDRAFWSAAIFIVFTCWPLSMAVGPLRRIDLVVAPLLVELCARRPSTATSVFVSFRAIKRCRR